MNPVDAKYILAEITSSHFKGSKWESSFITSINNRIESEQFLTTAQSKVLQEIYRKSQSGNNKQSRQYL